MLTVSTALALLLPALPLFTGLALVLRSQKASPAQGTWAMRLTTRLTWGLFGLAVVAAVLVFATDWTGPLTTSAVSLHPLGIVMTLLITLISGIVHSFSTRYMQSDPQLTRFAGNLSALTGAILLLVLTAHLVVFALAWLATTLLLTQLIGHFKNWSAAQASARRMRAVFLAGDAALITGLSLLAFSAGSVELGTVTAAAAQSNSWLVLLAALLIMIGGMARSAIVPFHSWLLNSMTAPTPVSAMMHAGLVNAGGFVVVRFHEVFLAVPTVLNLLFYFGAATALLGTSTMLVRGDVKRALGGSTIGQMGFMMMQCGLGAFAHAIYHLAAHGLYKASFFLSVGSTVGQKQKDKGSHQPSHIAAITLGALLAAGGVAAAMTSSLSVLGGSASAMILFFAVFTAAHSAAMLMTSGASLRNLALLAGIVGLCAGTYALGLWLVDAALGPALTEAMLPIGLGHWIVVGLFLLLWLAQLAVTKRSSLLPPALYVWLLNTGRSRSGAELTALRESQTSN